MYLALFCLVHSQFCIWRAGLPLLAQLHYPARHEEREPPRGPPRDRDGPPGRDRYDRGPPDRDGPPRGYDRGPPRGGLGFDREGGGRDFRDRERGPPRDYRGGDVRGDKRPRDISPR